MAEEKSGSKYSTEVVKLAAANTGFAFDLYQRQAAVTIGNMFMSPISISVALAMTYLGARNNTKSQMSQVLHFNEVEDAELHNAFSGIRKALNTADQPYKLYMANKLFGEKSYSFLDEYLNMSNEHYGAKLEPVDFRVNAAGAAALINRWVADNTAEKITDIVPPGVLDELTTLVLVNAVYLKADWREKFEPHNTNDEDFHVSGSETVRVKMMADKSTYKYGSNKELGACAIELPYKGDRLSMIIILPDPSRSLHDLETELSSTDLVNIQSKFQMTRCTVELYLPKFRLDEKLELTDLLKQMGIADAFKVGAADFSGMDGTKELSVSQVLHRAVVSVDEDGTEAAAATMVGMLCGCGAPPKIPPPVFRADRPFLFFIRDNETNTVIFIGRLVQPVAAY